MGVPEFQGEPMTRREVLVARHYVERVRGYLAWRGYFSPETAVRQGEDPYGEIQRGFLAFLAAPPFSALDVARFERKKQEQTFGRLLPRTIIRCTVLEWLMALHRSVYASRGGWQKTPFHRGEYMRTFLSEMEP